MCLRHGIATPMSDEQTNAKNSTDETGANIAAAIFLGFCLAIGFLLIDRFLGGAWRSLWSFLSSWFLLSLGAMPFGWYASEASGRHKKSWNRLLGQSTAFGAGIGLIYGIITQYLVPGVFFGCCIGHFVGFLLYFYGRDKASFPLPAAASAGAVLGVFMLCHCLGISTPTKLIRMNAVAAETASGDQWGEPAKPPVEEKPKGDKPKKTLVISGTELVDMNPIAVSKLPSRFVVTGRVLEMENSKTYWGTMQVTIKISGDADGFHKGPSGYVDEWVECEFSNIAGLEKVQKGHFVYIEGQYENNAIGKVVHLTKCRLSPEHHIVE